MVSMLRKKIAGDKRLKMKGMNVINEIRGSNCEYSCKCSFLE